MSEKQGYRDTIADLNERFPDKGVLTKSDVVKYLGVDHKTVDRWGIKFNSVTKRITKADLARQICV